MDTKRSYRHVCEEVKYGGTLTAEVLRDFVWTPFLTAVREVAGLNPGAASIFGLLK